MVCQGKYSYKLEYRAIMFTVFLGVIETYRYIIVSDIMLSASMGAGSGRGGHSRPSQNPKVHPMSQNQNPAQAGNPNHGLMPLLARCDTGYTQLAIRS